MTKPRRIGIAGVILLLFFCIIPELVAGIFELGLVLLAGWIPSGGRFLQLLPQAGDNLWLFVAGCVGLWSGVHLFCRWVSQHNGGLKSKWTLGHTSAILGGTCFVLFAVMGGLGAAHQVGWLIVSREPVFISRHSKLIERLMLDQAVKNLHIDVESNEWKVEPFQRSFYEGASNPLARDGQPYWERFNLNFHNVTNGTFAAVELVPIDPEVRSKYGIGLLERGKEPRRLNKEEAKRRVGVFSSDKHR